MSAEKSFWSVMLSVLIVTACAQTGGRTSGNARGQAGDDATEEADDDNAATESESTCEEAALVNGQSAASDCERVDEPLPPEQERDAGVKNDGPATTAPDSGTQPSAPRGQAANDAGEAARDDDEDQDEAEVVIEDEDDDDDDEQDEDEDQDEDADEDADEAADEDADQDEDQDEDAEDSDEEEEEQRVA
jgi:hypothetical protein